MGFVEVLNAYLPGDQEAILVGGALVEFLTGGAYTTGDVDLIGDRDAIGELLVGAGFEDSGRHFVQDDLGIVVEVVARHPEPGDTIVDVEHRGRTFPAWSIEDLIVDRLAAWAHWGSATDWEQARLLHDGLRDDIDEQLIEDKAATYRVREALEELRSAERETE